MRWRAHHLERILEKKFLSQKYHSMTKIKALYYKMEEDRRLVLYNTLNNLVVKKCRDAMTAVQIESEHNRMNAFILALEKIRRVHRKRMKSHYRQIHNYANSMSYNPWFEKSVSKLTVEAPLILQSTFWKMKRLVEDDIKELHSGKKTQNQLKRLCIMLDNKLNMQKSQAFYKI